MSNEYSNVELEGYLEEALPRDQMIEIENALRSDDKLGERLADVVGKMDAGVHALGSIWRRGRLSCPSREKLGSYLLKVLDKDEMDYLEFHLQTIGCRICNASLGDLSHQHAAADAEASESRRKKYFQTSAGYLSGDD
jgi:hypothetical protein